MPGIRPASFAVPREFLEILGKRTLAQLRPGDSVERKMTVLFSDIRGFTSLSESMTPRQAFAFINEYLGQMEPVLIRNRGFVDKFIGDAMMALFPGGADDGLRAAIGILRQLDRRNAAARKRGEAPIRIGIALNTGLMMVGAVGGVRRMEATVIGDAVNLASRLESLTKTYGVPLLIGEHTYYDLARRSDFDVRLIDRARVRGKEQPQSVYEVFACDPPATRAAKRRTRRGFEEALACYHFRDIVRARKLLRRCLAQCPDDRPARIYLERCERFDKTGVHESTGEVDLRITWSPEFAIGHALIDEQHRELFARVNDFAEALRTTRTGAQAVEIIAFLRRYVEIHFATEERCMAEHGYPLLELEREQHQRFSRDLTRLTAEIRSHIAEERLFMLFKIQLLVVVDWLVNHTLKVDGHFGRYLRRMQGASPERSPHDEPQKSAKLPRGPARHGRSRARPRLALPGV